MTGFIGQLPLAIRYAYRDMRAGLRGFYIFALCLLLGVASIAIIGTLASAIEAGVAEQGQPLLGGDVEFALVHREVTDDERAYLDGLGDLSTVATMRGVTASRDQRSLIEVKAVDQAYPLYGAAELASGQNIQAALAQSNGQWGTVIEEGLAARLDAKVGDTLSLGNIELKIAGLLTHEPDRVSGGFILAPRLMVSIDALRASGLAAPGSLVRWRYRVKLNGQSGLDRAKAVIGQAEKDLPDAGWRIRTTDAAAPAIDRFLDRLSFFLTLVGLTALIVGGVGIANAVKSFLDRRRDTIAMLKCLGSPASLIFLTFFCEVMIIASFSILAGVILGAAAPVLLNGLLREVLPVPVAFSIDLTPLLLAAFLGYLVTIAFSIWPLARARNLPASALFSPGAPVYQKPPGMLAISAIAAAFIVLATMTLIIFPERHITIWYIGGVTASFAVLLGLAHAVMRLAQRHLAPQRAILKLAVSNLYRPGAPTPSVILSLGLGLTVFVTLSLVDLNISRELRSSVPQDAPSFFFFDVQNDERDDFVKFLETQPGVESIDSAPMLRGQVVSINGVATKDVKVSPDAAWALRGDRGLTYAKTLPDNATITAGEWWPPDYDGEPLVSFTQDIANAIGLKIGETVTINVLGRPITARVANLRSVDWRSLEINFVMLFSPNTLQGAPHAHVVTANVADQHQSKLINSVNKGFPTVAGIRVKDAIEAVSGVLAQLLTAIRSANVITFVIGLLVLAGALASGLSNRVYDAMVLKTYGATRAQLIASFALEYGLLGLVSAAFSIIIGSIASWAIMKFVMDAPWAFSPASAAGVALSALTITITIGLIATRQTLSSKPARILRTE